MDAQNNISINSNNTVAEKKLEMGWGCRNLVKHLPYSCNALILDLIAWHTNGSNPFLALEIIWVNV